MRITLGAVLIIALFISGCSTKTVKNTEEQPVLIIKPDRPPALEPREVKVNVISDKDDSGERFKETFTGRYVFVALKIKDYENLSQNIQDIVSYIKKQNNIIEYYESMIDFYNQGTENDKSAIQNKK